MSTDAEEDGLGLFQEPDDFYQPEKEATFASHALLSGEKLEVRLVGHNPLWGHHLWNAGRTTSTYLETHAASLIQNKTVLELGAGAGLPSLICALNGASKVVVTDYPDAELIENLRYNIEHCSALGEKKKKGDIVAEAYLWGTSSSALLSHIPCPSPSPSNPSNPLSSLPGFDTLILADLLFNHSEHRALLHTITLCLKRHASSRAYVFFTPYRPWLLEKDLAFFDLARDAGFVVNKVLETVMDKVMFEEDPGDELLRRTVFGYEVFWEQELGEGAKN